MAPRARKSATKHAPRKKDAGDAAETRAFEHSLSRHGQLQADDAPLRPGVTHVVKKPAKGKPATVVRKRFSAL